MKVFKILMCDEFIGFVKTKRQADKLIRDYSADITNAVYGDDECDSDEANAYADYLKNTAKIRCVDISQKAWNNDRYPQG